MKSIIQDLLNRLKRDLSILYGDMLSHIILFGSQARGDDTPDSDIDIMIVLNRDTMPELEDERVSKVTGPLCREYDVVISCITVPEGRFLLEDTPFLRNVRNEGIVL